MASGDNFNPNRSLVSKNISPFRVGDVNERNQPFRAKSVIWVNLFRKVEDVFLAATKWLIVRSSTPCIRLARGKFELTNQDSAGGKKSSVLTSSKQVRKGFEIRQLFFLEMALNIHEKGKGFFPKPYQCAKSEKYEPFCVSQLLFWRQKMGRS